MTYALVILTAVCLAGQPCTDHRQSIPAPDYPTCQSMRRDLVSSACRADTTTAIAACVPTPAEVK